MKAQIGRLVTGDFSENTITIEIQGEMIIAAGNYAVVPLVDYAESVALLTVAKYSEAKLSEQRKNLLNSLKSSFLTTNP